MLIFTDLVLSSTGIKYVGGLSLSHAPLLGKIQFIVYLIDFLFFIALYVCLVLVIYESHTTIAICTSKFLTTSY